MHAKKYFKLPIGSDLGEGIAYFEFTDAENTRAVEVYGDTWRWADRDHPDHLQVDQLPDPIFHDEHEITAEDFEQAWLRSHEQG